MDAVLFTATANPQSSQTFYEGILGLNLVSDMPHSMVYDINGTTLRVQKVEQVIVLPYTALGFVVDDIAERVRSLSDKGVHFEQFESLQQDEDGIWTTPDGAKIAWCKDPDGNLVSLTQRS